MSMKHVRYPLRLLLEKQRLKKMKIIDVCEAMRLSNIPHSDTGDKDILYVQLVLKIFPTLLGLTYLF